MSKMLVTGGAGFIGSHVAEILIHDGHEVVVLDDLSGGLKNHVPRGAEFVKGSILDYGLLKDLFARHPFAYVFHLAAYAAEGLSHFIKRFNYENNLMGSVNLINLSILHKIKCFIFTSSIAVYGRNQLPMIENFIPQPQDPYGIAKYAVEQELKVSQDMFGLPYLIFRPHNVYGERQNIGDRYRNVIGIFMNQIMQEMPMTIFGNGEQKRAFSYISDVAPIIARSINYPNAFNGVFNIGADTPHTINQLAIEVARAFQVEPKIRYLEPRNEVEEAYSDHAKVRYFFKCEPRVTLTDGLKQMALWVKQYGSRKTKVFTDIEVNVNMPSSWSSEFNKREQTV